MKLATDSEHVVITGTNGSGKSHEALYQLSQRSFDTRPWVIVNFKRGDLVDQVPVTARMTVHDAPPTDPGLYVADARWEDGQRGGALDRFLMKCLDQGRIGIFIDEGQMLTPPHYGLRSVLTRGRHPEVCLMFITQRPAHVDTFAFSECKYIQMFQLFHPDDHARIAAYVPPDMVDFDALAEAGEHHSLYFDLRARTVELVGPAPDFMEIHRRILTRLPVYVDAKEPVRPPRIRL